MPSAPEQITIQPATGEEREWAAQLIAYSEPWITLGVSLQTCRSNCNDPAYHLYTAHINNKPAGLILLQDKGVAGSPYIKTIAVEPSFRNSGIGTALMHFAEEKYRHQSAHLFLCVSSFNTKAQQFYERLGYSKVGEFENYIINGASELLFYKRLQ